MRRFSKGPIWSRQAGRSSTRSSTFGMRYRLATFRTTPRAHGDRKIPTNFLPSTAGHGRIRLMRKILLKKDLEDLSSFAAELFVQIANESVADHGSFSV